MAGLIKTKTISLHVFYVLVLLHFVKAEDGQLLTRLPKVKIIRNSKREGRLMVGGPDHCAYDGGVLYRPGKV